MNFKQLIIIFFTLLYSHSVFAKKPIDVVQANFVDGVLNDVLIKDSLASTKHLNTLQQSLKSFKQQPSQGILVQIQNEFKLMMQSWKAVEAVYVAGALDEDFLDHPRFIDFFHQANESIPDLMDRALKSKNPLKQSLFKYSTKSINALEYLLFSTSDKELINLMSQDNFRRIKAASIIISNMQLWLNEVSDFYQQDQKLKADPAHALGLIVNTLIDSSYKLVNWRVGEAGGLAKKHFGKPSAKHLEYSHAQSSMLAVKAILKTHRQIIDREGEKDLLAIAKIKKVSSELLFIRKKVDEAIALVELIPQPTTKSLESNEYKALHKTLDQLHNAYYFLLIDALGLSANIIDADGD